MSDVARYSSPSSIPADAMTLTERDHEPSAPEVTSIPLRIPVALYPSGFRTALQRGVRVLAHGVRLDVARPRAMRLRLGRQRLACRSFSFPDVGSGSILRRPEAAGSEKAPATKPSGVDGGAAAGVEGAARDRARRTRILPPTDVVKLQDRLYYMLQPPLETLVASGSMQFPFEPFPYQFEGIAFLYPRYAAILADEMGLGKTMQSISTIRMLLRSGELRRVLLICPKPLVTNWRREFAQWAPEIPVAVIEGDKEKRQWQWLRSKSPVTIANYELLMRDRDLFEGPETLHFDLVVLDEAQRIKNRNSTTSEIVRSISRSRNWALTGTPIENSPEDLVGIFEFLAPGHLQSEMPARRMGELARDYVLRRTKDMVLKDLPPKMYRDAELSLTAEQWATYKTAEDEGVIRLNEMGSELTIQHVFELVLRLKQICNFDPLTGASCKLERLVADLEEIALSGKKAIIFSQWVETLHGILPRVERFGALEYHGRIPSKRRDAIVDQFRNDPSKGVLLMSYGAGSVGINLQFCEYVFLFDRWWNPAVEDQAINRAHRIGSAGPVTVTRMLAQDTIEQRINQVLEEKRELFASIFSEVHSPRSAGLSQKDIFGLFNLRTPHGPLREVA